MNGRTGSSHELKQLRRVFHERLHGIVLLRDDVEEPRLNCRGLDMVS